MRMKDEEFEEVIRINLEAAFRLMRAAAKPMMKARFGRIISITSVVGVTGNPGQANYVASKAGLIGMTKSVAQELASRNITVNAIAPGFMTSAMTDALNEQQRAGILSRIPMGAMGSGEDIGAACVYLASKEAGYVTGQTIHVNGGMAMLVTRRSPRLSLSYGSPCRRNCAPPISRCNPTFRLPRRGADEGL